MQVETEKEGGEGLKSVKEEETGEVIAIRQEFQVFAVEKDKQREKNNESIIFFFSVKKSDIEMKCSTPNKFYQHGY